MPRIPFVHLLVAAFLLPSTALAEDAWALRDVQALRWPDAQQTTLELEHGDKVTVVYRDAGMVRVRLGAEFGWVPADALADQDPEPAAEATDPWAIPDMPTLDLPAMGKAPRFTPAPDAAPAAPATPPPAK